MDVLTYVVGFVARAALRFAPLFLLSIGLAAVVRSLPVADVASRWLARREHASVAAGSLLGAFSPFCSCTVVPVVRGLLVAGAPLAGVMAFWVASPLMDPEIFVVTVGLLGWPLAVARLLAALLLALLAGAGAAVLVRRGALPAGLGAVDRSRAPAEAVAPTPVAPRVPVGVGAALPTPAGPGPSATTSDACCSDAPAPATTVARAATATAAAAAAAGGAVAPDDPSRPGVLGTLRALDWRRVGRDARAETWTLGRWILVAFALEALILRFVPQEALVGVLGSDAPWAVPLAAALGLPLYLDNLSALPVVAGLLEQGMTPGAAIAFLLAGPVTTVPAMTAVRAVLPGPVFRYYLAVALLGSATLGLLVDVVL